MQNGHQTSSRGTYIILENKKKITRESLGELEKAVETLILILVFL